MSEHRSMPTVPYFMTYIFFKCFSGLILSYPIRTVPSFLGRSNAAVPVIISAVSSFIFLFEETLRSLRWVLSIPSHFFAQLLQSRDIGKSPRRLRHEFWPLTACGL